MKTCSIDGCGQKKFCRGYCSAHYHRWQRYGSPTGGGPPMRGKTEIEDWIVSHIDYASDDCLTWPFGRSDNGYPVYYPGKKKYAHRVMCERKHGPSPTPKHEVAHSCGKGHEACVNPLHLRWDTRKGNAADKLEHGTDARGEKCPTHKLTEEQVLEIRSLQGSMTQAEIGRLYGVTQTAISLIHRRARWFCLP